MAEITHFPRPSPEERAQDQEKLDLAQRALAGVSDLLREVNGRGTDILNRALKDGITGHGICPDMRAGRLNPVCSILRRF